MPPRPTSIESRASKHAALGDPVRLAIVDDLVGSDRSPAELRHRFGLESNLLSHHLDVLENAGLIERSRSSGDGRRRYVHLREAAVELLGGRSGVRPGPALFVCTANSARSQLAAALWVSLTGASARSCGTHPAPRIAPGAEAAARRAGLDLSSRSPRSFDSIGRRPAIVVTVCDRAHEELDPPADWLHWSIDDPVVTGTPAAFDRTLDELRGRILRLTDLAVAS